MHLLIICLNSGCLRVQIGMASWCFGVPWPPVYACVHTFGATSRPSLIPIKKMIETTNYSWQCIWQLSYPEGWWCLYPPLYFEKTVENVRVTLDFDYLFSICDFMSFLKIGDYNMDRFFFMRVIGDRVGVHWRHAYPQYWPYQFSPSCENQETRKPRIVVA